MSDERLRALERRWLETGAEEDELAWDQERERQGLPLRVLVAASVLRAATPAEVEANAADQIGFQEVVDLLAAVRRRPHAPWVVWDFSAVTDLPPALAGQLVATAFNLRDMGGGLVACGVSGWVAENMFGVELLSPLPLAECLRERGWEPRGPTIQIEHLQ